MKDTNNKEKMNRIIKKAGELFDEVEDLSIRIGDDKTAEMLAEEMGGYLKSAKGFDLLQYTFLLAQTTSERAIMDFEDAIRYLKEEDLSDLFLVLENFLKVAEILEDDKPNIRHLILSVKRKKDDAKMFMNYMKWEYWSRSKSYREEIEIRNKHGLN